MMDDSRFWLTGSDFSELAVLNYSLMEEMSKQIDQEKLLKTAKFKRMDWDQIEKNLISKAAGTRHHDLANKQGDDSNQIKIERQSIEELSQAKEEIPDTAQQQSPQSKPVDWINYLPRLRKSLRGLHPAKLQGEIWPQKQRTITYKGGTIDPVKASKVAAHRYQQKVSLSNQKQMMNTTFNFADKISRVKIPAISLNTDIMMDTYGSKPTTKEILMRARSQERSGTMAFDRKFDQQHVFIVNEESTRHKTPAPLPKEYDGRYYQTSPNDIQSNNGGASSPATHRLSQNRQLMSPRFFQRENGPFINQARAAGGTIVATPTNKNNDFGSTLVHPTPSPMTSARANSIIQVKSSTKKDTKHRNSKDVISETETLIDQNEFPSQKSQLGFNKKNYPTDPSYASGFANEHGQTRGNTTAQRVSYRPLNDRNDGNITLTNQQPSSLNIKQITMAPIDPKLGKVSPRWQQQKVYPGLIKEENHNQMQVVVSMKKNHILQSQDKFNVSGSVSKHPNDREETMRNFRSKRGSNKFAGKTKFSNKSSPKNFKKTVEELYLKKKELSEGQQHQSNYLNRVERIREETSGNELPTKGLAPSPSQPLTEANISHQNHQNEKLYEDFSKKNIHSDSDSSNKVVNQQVQLQGSTSGLMVSKQAESTDNQEPLSATTNKNWRRMKQQEVEIKFVCNKTENSDDELGIVATGVKLHQGNTVQYKKQQQLAKRARERADLQIKEIDDIENTLEDKSAQAKLDQPSNSNPSSPGIRKAVMQSKLKSETQSNEDYEFENIMGSQNSQHMDQVGIPHKIMGTPRYHEAQTPGAQSQSRQKGGSSLQQKMNRQGRISRIHARQGEPSSPSPIKYNMAGEQVSNADYEEMINGPIKLTDSLQSPIRGATDASTVVTASVSGGQRDFDSRSRSIQLEGIFVRRQNQLGPMRPIALDTKFVMTNLNITTPNSRQNFTQMSPLKTKQLNLASIPDSIRTEAIYDMQTSVGPRQKARRYSTISSTKPKRVEDIETILNRVVRARCCLANQNPEQLDVMQRAVGDSVVDYMRSPGRKALRIRLKFLQNQFCQNVTEDFMSVQNLDRQVEQTIEWSVKMFHQFEIVKPDEQQLMLRLFKRFFFNTIEHKFGYLKMVQDKVEVSGRMLCSELELNPKVLPLCGIMTVFSEDAMIHWPAFLKIMTLFLLQKDVLDVRYEFILRFLKLTTNHTDLDRVDYLQEMLNKFQFSQRSIIVQNIPTLVFWNKLRVQLANKREEIFDLGRSNTLNMMKALRVLSESDLTAEDTFPFFDTLFDIA